jgi:hypothetical protein
MDWAQLGMFWHEINYQPVVRYEIVKIDCQKRNDKVVLWYRGIFYVPKEMMVSIPVESHIGHLGTVRHSWHSDYGLTYQWYMVFSDRSPDLKYMGIGWLRDGREWVIDHDLCIWSGIMIRNVNRKFSSM